MHAGLHETRNGFQGRDRRQIKPPGALREQLVYGKAKATERAPRGPEGRNLGVPLAFELTAVHLIAYVAAVEVIGLNAIPS